MGKFNMRARLRKASCLTDDCYDDAESQDGMSHTQPVAAAPPEDTEPHPTSPPIAPEETTRAAAAGPAAGAEEQDDPRSPPDPQLQSAFFAGLPAEVRRLVYAAVFRARNPLMKMHLHGSCDGARLTATPCRYAPRALFSTQDDERDPMQTDPWPGWRGRNQPPRWFWHAWGLRLRWRGHWKCQAEAMMQWSARGDGTCVDLRERGGGGWMGLFLCCRRMYAEAIECLFESTELIFTASEDAYRFFVQNPHSHVARLRRLDLAFNHFKDHLFLQPIEAPRQTRGPPPSDADGGAASATALPVSWELWAPLTARVRAALPALRYLRVHLSPPSARCEALARVLDDWEREGYGWVTEQADGVVYYEMRRSVMQEGSM